jgi:bifunctional DNA-binding transcriptional regulator/antitoxin component of YhaV-PrlF toxin-antitoxin module
MHDRITTVTERGQVSIPATIRKALNLKPGQKLRWQQISNHECRVFHDLTVDAPGPVAMLGYARKLKPQDLRSTEEWMKELREGEKP